MYDRRLVVHVLHVATEVATLSKCLAAVLARERPLSGMLPEMIAQIARFFEDGAAAFIHAPKI